MARLDVITRFSFSSPFRHRSASAASATSQASTSTAASPTTRSRAVYSPISPDTYSNRDSVMSSPEMTINSVIFRQPSIVNLEEERRSFGNELGILEPRPIVYWGGVEERMHLA